MSSRKFAFEVNDDVKVKESGAEGVVSGIWITADCVKYEVTPSAKGEAEPVLYEAEALEKNEA